MKNLPLYLAKMVLTIDEHWSGEAGCRFSTSFKYGNSSHKYKPIMDELRNAFYSINNESRYNHVSGLDYMLSEALSQTIAGHEGGAALVLELLDEAFIPEHPLSVFGFSIPSPSQEESLLKFFHNDEDFDAPLFIFPIFEICEGHLQRIASNILNHIEISSEAGLIDLLVFIRQYFCSRDYFFDSRGDEFFYKIIFICSNFPTEAYTVIFDFISRVKNVESTEVMFKAIYAHFCAVDPMAFAPFKHILDNNSLKDRFILVHFFEKRLERNFSLPELRLYTIALWKHVGLYAFHFPTPIYQEDGNEFQVSFRFEVVKQAERLFPGISSFLNGELGVGENLRTEFESLLLELVPSLQAAVPIYLLCFHYGFLESIKYLEIIQSKISSVMPASSLLLAVMSRNAKFTNTLLDKDMLKSFVAESSAGNQIKLLEEAAKCCPLEIFETFFEKVIVSSSKEVHSIAKEAISERQFNNFDFLCQHFDASSLDRRARFELIQAALECRLPEAKIQNYIASFGADIMLQGDQSENGKLLVPAAQNGLYALIKQFNLCDAETEFKLEALEKALMNEHDKIFNLLMSTFEENLGIVQCASISWLLVQFRRPEVLKHFISKRFGNQIDAEFKAQFLLSLIITYYNTKYESKHLIKRTILEFCRYMNWTRGSIQYSTETGHLLNLEALDWPWTRRYGRLMQNCLDFMD